MNSVNDWFPDDVKCFANPTACDRQNDVELLADWVRNWLLTVNPSKCVILHVILWGKTPSTTLSFLWSDIRLILVYLSLTIYSWVIIFQWYLQKLTDYCTVFIVSSITLDLFRKLCHLYSSPFGISPCSLIALLLFWRMSNENSLTKVPADLKLFIEEKLRIFQLPTTNEEWWSCKNCHDCSGFLWLLPVSIGHHQIINSGEIF